MCVKSKSYRVNNNACRSKGYHELLVYLIKYQEDIRRLHSSVEIPVTTKFSSLLKPRLLRIWWPHTFSIHFDHVLPRSEHSIPAVLDYSMHLPYSVRNQN